MDEQSRDARHPAPRRDSGRGGAWRYFSPKSNISKIILTEVVNCPALPISTSDTHSPAVILSSTETPGTKKSGYRSARQGAGYPNRYPDPLEGNALPSRSQRRGVQNPHAIHSPIARHNAVTVSGPLSTPTTISLVRYSIPACNRTS